MRMHVTCARVVNACHVCILQEIKLRERKKREMEKKKERNKQRAAQMRNKRNMTKIVTDHVNAMKTKLQAQFEEHWGKFFANTHTLLTHILDTHTYLTHTHTQNSHTITQNSHTDLIHVVTHILTHTRTRARAHTHTQITRTNKHTSNSRWLTRTVIHSSGGTEYIHICSIRNT